MAKSFREYINRKLFAVHTWSAKEKKQRSRLMSDEIEIICYWQGFYFSFKEMSARKESFKIRNEYVLNMLKNIRMRWFLAI